MAVDFDDTLVPVAHMVMREGGGGGRRADENIQSLKN